MLKRKYKLILRILLYSVLAGLIVYALLPWILPMGLVKRKLTAQIERDFGRPVQIGEITVSWGEGVQIRDLVIQRKGKYGVGELLRVGRLHTSFRPLQMLYSGLDVVLMEDVDFYVVATKEDLNVLDLPPLEMTRLIVDKARIHFETHLEGQISKVIFEAGSTVIDNDKETDAFSWEFSARQLGQSEPTIVSRGQIGKFQHRSSEQNQQKIWISLRNLDLSTLGIERWINQGHTSEDKSETAVRTLVSSIKGSWSGEISLQLADNQEMSGEGRFKVTDLEVTGQEGEEAAQLWGALETLSGKFTIPQYDPVTNWLRVAHLEIECPGLAFQGEGEYDPREGAGQFLCMKVREGCVEPALLAETIPVLKQESWSGLLGKGQIRFETEFHAHERTETGQLVLDGTDWEFAIGDIAKPAGTTLKLELNSELDYDEDVLVLSVNNLEWASLQGKGDLTLPNWYQLSTLAQESDPEQELRGVLHHLIQGASPSQLQAKIAIGDLSEFAPYLTGQLGSSVNLALSGAVQAEISTQGDKAGHHFSLQVQLPAAAQGVWSDASKVVWQKEPGKDFRLECSGRWKVDESAIENAKLHSTLGGGTISFGPGRLVFRDEEIKVAGTDPGAGIASMPVASTMATTDITGRLKSPLLAQVNGTWRIEGISDWLAALPIFKEELTKQGIDIQGSLTGDLTYRNDARQTLECSDHIDFTDLQLRMYSEPGKYGSASTAKGRSLIFQKPAGETAKVSVSARENHSDHTIEYHVQGQIGAIEGRGDGRAVRLVSAEAGGGPVRQRHWDIEGEIKNVEALPRYFGDLFDEQGWFEEGGYRVGDLQGQIHLKGQWHIGELAESFQFAFDGSKSRFVLAEAGGSDKKQVLWNKSTGSPFTIQGELTITEKDGLIGALIGKPGKRPPSRLAKIKTLHVEAAGLSADGTGDVIYEESEEPEADWLSMGRQVKLNLSMDLDHDGTLGQEVPLLADVQRQAGLHGKTHLDCSLEWNREQQRLQCSGAADLTQTAAAFTCILDPNQPEPIQVSKPAGDNLHFAFALGAEGETDELNVDKIQMQFGRNTITLSGQLRGVQWSDWPTLENQSSPFPTRFSLEFLPAKEADWRLHVEAPKLKELTKWLSPLQEIALEGHLEADLNIYQQFEPTAARYWKPSQVSGALHWHLDRWPMEFEIREMDLSSARLVVPEATVHIGQNHLTLVVDIEEPILSMGSQVQEYQQPKGRIDIISGKLDLDDIQVFLNDWQEKLEASKSSEGSHPPQDTPPPIQYEDIQNILSILRRCELTGLCAFDDLSFTDPANSVRMDLDKMLGRYEIVDGIFQIQFAAGVGGGAVEATIRSDLKQPDPKIEYTQTARELQANEMLRGIVESEFPGLEVTGTISEKKELTGALFQILATNQGWQGEGVTQCTQGVLFGPGGPGWMLRVFPGLKLVEYNWRAFTNEYDLASDGTKKNKMLFKGETYNIYINGESKPIQETAQYHDMIKALETDLKASREKLKALDQGELELSEGKARRLRLRTTGLEQLWQKHQAGQTLRAFKADYNVGGLISAGGGKKFQKPTEILRIPIFRTQSYIVERHMVGIQTSNVPLGPLGR